MGPLAEPDRRALLSLAIAAAAGVGAQAAEAAAAADELDDPHLAPRLAWELSARLAWEGGRHPTGAYASGQRIYNTLAGGAFRGPRVRGVLLPGGGDWAVMNPPEATLYQAGATRQVIFDARYILRTDDGEHIYVSNRGGRFIGPDASDSPYSVTTPLFDAPLGGRYGFLARNIYVGLALTRPTDTLLYVYRVIA